MAKRARANGGRYKGDDPKTPDVNEAWEQDALYDVCYMLYDREDHDLLNGQAVSIQPAGYAWSPMDEEPPLAVARNVRLTRPDVDKLRRRSRRIGSRGSLVSVAKAKHKKRYDVDLEDQP